ncbi:long-chain-fatty-acid--CoA ligase [Gordonia terrae]|uniref:Long-chain fatty acid--CoA ligase n=2 Tax=Gordonia terrae TaxID=2055 RepID=A0AAD0K4P0_9ACTN|nr:long-chain-fatty-acid--CoA ligase [Gordonia terrae]AWO82565.1 long-chain fatty acid--CoA ligase [Gordonia terrae]GAB44770.1 fatty-acid--CoA ligase [Gordonia terrae NBRC 100016]VTR09148.1 acyl-CoA synthetase (AMP-forming)/AMP-acid ligase II [Clostridioides difficile]VTS21902.1 Short-chain-fatty-acid--CoA ligase [Gordonia terrae]
MISNTMQEFSLAVNAIFEHGRRVHADAEVVSYRDGVATVRTFADIGDESDSLAAVLDALRVAPGECVATMMWNHSEHLSTYFGVTCSGRVLHPLNPRLPVEQLAHMIHEAQDRVLIVDSHFSDMIGPMTAGDSTIEHVIVVNPSDDSPPEWLDFDKLVVESSRDRAPRVIDEHSAAVLCYTSGTSGSPKGVVYSHRAIFLHTFAISMPNVYSIGESDSVLVSVAIYHTNAASLHLAAWMAGARIVLPGRHLQPEPMAHMIERERVTLAVGVVTLWSDLLGRWQDDAADLSSLRLIVSGGSAAPRDIIEFYRARGVPMIQGWGMTESLGICSMGHPPSRLPEGDQFTYLAMAGRVIPGVQLRVLDVETGDELPFDGQSSGELSVRGPWVAARYFGQSPGDDDWFPTGDIGSVTHNGYVRITDRIKDVIKSGGEWISSIDLENAIRTHPDVEDVAVIGVDDSRWQERPLAVVVTRAGSRFDPEALSAWTSDRVARWWVPERWSSADSLPRTVVGKLDKRSLHSRYGTGQLNVITVHPLSPTGSN